MVLSMSLIAAIGPQTPMCCAWARAQYLAHRGGVRDVVLFAGRARSGPARRPVRQLRRPGDGMLSHGVRWQAFQRFAPGALAGTPGDAPPGRTGGRTGPRRRAVLSALAFSCSTRTPGSTRPCDRSARWPMASAARMCGLAPWLARWCGSCWARLRLAWPPASAAGLARATAWSRSRCGARLAAGVAVLNLRRQPPVPTRCAAKTGKLSADAPERSRHPHRRRPVTIFPDTRV
jgi:hypothetical protein